MALGENGGLWGIGQCFCLEYERISICIEWNYAACTEEPIIEVLSRIMSSSELQRRYYDVDQAPYLAAPVIMIASNALFFHRLPNISSHHEASYCRSVL